MRIIHPAQIEDNNGMICAYALSPNVFAWIMADMMIAQDVKRIVIDVLAASPSSSRVNTPSVMYAAANPRPTMFWKYIDTRMPIPAISELDGMQPIVESMLRSEL